MSRKYNNLYIEVKPVHAVTAAETREIISVAANSFGREETEEMAQDTIDHIEASDQVSVAHDGGRIVAIAMARRLELADSFEWMGGIVLPSHQSGGLMTRLLAAQCFGYDRHDLVACTRSPKIARMLGKISSDVVPIDTNHHLHELAMSMPYATEVDGVAYHIGRYGEEGLYGDDDPASQPLHKGEVPFSQRFPELQDVRNSLVLAARVRSDNTI